MALLDACLSMTKCLRQQRDQNISERVATHMRVATTHHWSHHLTLSIRLHSTMQVEYEETPTMISTIDVLPPPQAGSEAQSDEEDEPDIEEEEEEEDEQLGTQLADRL